MKFERLGKITRSLDNMRIPLNSLQRGEKGNIGLYPYIGANGILGYIDEYIFDEKILCVAEDGGSWGAQQKCATVYEEKCWVNNHAHVLSENGNANLEYICYYLNYADLNKHITGTTRGKLTKRELESISVPLPSLNTQTHIANILSKAEALIAQRKESLRLLDELLKSTFLEMFGNPVKNEKGWEKVALSKLGILDRGVSKNRPRNAPELLGGKYPLVQTGDVANSDLYITSYSQTYSELGLQQSKLWKKGTLLITVAANIAKTSILTFDACFPDSIVGFITNTKEACIVYVHFLFSFFQEILEKNAPQAAQKNINLALLRNLPVPKPPLPLQKQFASMVEKVEALKKDYQQSLEQLENLYGSLSQRAFRGELELPESSSSSASFLKAATAHVESMHYAKEHKDNAPVVAQAQQKTYYTPREVIRLINSLDSVRLNIPEEEDRLYALDRPFPFKDSKARYFSFAEIEELIKHSDWQAEYSYLREEFFMLFRQGKLRQVYADAEFKAGFNEQHPQYQEVQALEEKMYLQFVGFIIS